MLWKRPQVQRYKSQVVTVEDEDRLLLVLIEPSANKSENTTRSEYIRYTTGTSPVRINGIDNHSSPSCTNGDTWCKRYTNRQNHRVSSASYSPTCSRPILQLWESWWRARKWYRSGWRWVSCVTEKMKTDTIRMRLNKSLLLRRLESEATGKGGPAALIASQSAVWIAPRTICTWKCHHRAVMSVSCSAGVHSR